MTACFTPDFLAFFRDLAANNHREYFHAHKKRYETSVKQPFADFIGLLIAAIRQEDPRVRISPAQAIFRIHRDVRFSQDKSPYKLYASALIVPGTRRITGDTGFYLEFSPEHCGVYGGLYQPDKQQLENVRTAIAQDPGRLDRLMSAPAFRERFGEILGEKNVRLPAHFQSVRAVQPLIAHKQFYFRALLPAETILRPDLPDLLMAYYRAAKPLNDYLEEAGRSYEL
jgi:uncharacterized protein (TIGR02453 family)